MQSGKHENSLRPRGTVLYSNGQIVDGRGTPATRKSATADAALSE